MICHSQETLDSSKSVSIETKKKHHINKSSIIPVVFSKFKSDKKSPCCFYSPLPNATSCTPTLPEFSSHRKNEIKTFSACFKSDTWRKRGAVCDTTRKWSFSRTISVVFSLKKKWLKIPSSSKSCTVVSEDEIEQGGDSGEVELSRRAWWS